MSCGAMNITQLLYIIRAMEQPLLLLLCELLLAISMIYSIDLLIILLLLSWQPLIM
jgi:hypothetical protein